MSAIADALLAQRQLARQTKQCQRLGGVLQADGLASRRRSAPRRDEHVLGQRSAGRMAQFTARLTVPDLALFAHNGRDFRVNLAHLTPERLALAEPIDNRLHCAVRRQVPGAGIVEEHHFPANRARQRVHGAARRRKQQRLQVRCARVRARP